MSKIIEQVAVAMHAKGVEFDWFTKPYCELTDLSREKYNILAKAAIEALGVIVLPHDAEPQEGDVIKAWGDHDELVNMASQVVAPTINWGYWNNYQHVKIIERNGLPVIMESAPSSEEVLQNETK